MKIFNQTNWIHSFIHFFRQSNAHNKCERVEQRWMSRELFLLSASCPLPSALTSLFDPPRSIIDHGEAVDTPCGKVQARAIISLVCLIYLSAVRETSVYCKIEGQNIHEEPHFRNLFCQELMRTPIFIRDYYEKMFLESQKIPVFSKPPITA